MEERLDKRMDKEEDSFSKFTGVVEKQLARVGLTERGAFGHYGLETPFNTVAELGEL